MTIATIGLGVVGDVDPDKVEVQAREQPVEHRRDLVTEVAVGGVKQGDGGSQRG